MTETIQSSGLWHVTLVERDLVKQAGLNQDDFEQDFGFFKYRGRAVIISHRFNDHLVVSMEAKEDRDMKTLIDGFSKVVNYQPFCKYSLMPKKENNHPPLPTYEWDKINPDERYKELTSKKTVSSLIRL
ncbi:MAG: hypothetical protein ABIG37_01245 [Nanoarchaeota archaeon]|nr:hypothetical protein [Nanoarchaeota archaeon]